MDDDVGAERIRAAARGDRDAAEAVVRALLPRVRNLVRYLVRGDRDVDDITQTALLAVLKGLPTYRHEAPLAKWADRLVARETFRHLRRQRLTDAREVEATMEYSAPTSEADATLSRRRVLAAALDTLPEAQRVVVALHHAAGFTVPELAELLDIPRETVRSRLRLGMNRLRERFSPEEAS